MPLSSSQKAVGYIAGVFGTLQALIWFTLSLVCLIYYSKDITIHLQSISIPEAIYLRFLNSEFFNLYFSDDLIVEPAAFSAYNWVYVVLDFFWFILSANLVLDIATNKEKLYKSIRSFTFATLLISILDLIFVISVAIDYNKSCASSELELNTQFCEKAVIPVLVIGAKGFVLWIMNVILAYMLKNIATVLKLEAMEAERETWTVTPVTLYTPAPPVNTLIVEETTVVVAFHASFDTPSSTNRDQALRY